MLWKISQKKKLKKLLRIIQMVFERWFLWALCHFYLIKRLLQIAYIYNMGENFPIEKAGKLKQMWTRRIPWSLRRNPGKVQRVSGIKLIRKGIEIDKDTTPLPFSLNKCFCYFSFYILKKKIFTIFFVIFCVTFLFLLMYLLFRYFSLLLKISHFNLF